MKYGISITRTTKNTYISLKYLGKAMLKKCVTQVESIIKDEINKRIQPTKKAPLRFAFLPTDINISHERKG